MHEDPIPVLTPMQGEPQAFDDAAPAVARLETLYAEATGFLIHHFTRSVLGDKPTSRIRAYYPEIRLTVASHAKVDSR